MSIRDLGPLGRAPTELDAGSVAPGLRSRSYLHHPLIWDDQL